MLEANRRISKGRSRNGCNTCKIRRIKCDEGKPVCNKCTSTGRACEYLAPRSPKSDLGVGTNDLRIVQHIPNIPKPIRMWQVSQSNGLVYEAEYRSLEFFQLHTSLCFGPNIGSFLLRAAHYEPTIRTIAIAIGSLHRSFLFDQHRSSPSWEGTRFTLFQYNKAIKQLIDIQPYTSPQTNDTFLIACVLFFCFECLQGHYKSAFQHAVAGLKIIKQQQMISSPPSLMYMPPRIINVLFTILDSQLLEIQGERSLAMELRPSMSSCHHLNYDMSQTPCSIEEFEASFQLLYNRFTRFETFCESMEETSKMQALGDAAQAGYIHDELSQIYSDMKTWMTVFDEWLQRQPPSQLPDPETDNKIMILKVWRTTVELLIQLDWPYTELTWDRHTAKFNEVVCLTEKMFGIPLNFFPSSASITPDIPRAHYVTPFTSSSSNPTSLPPLRPKPMKSLSSMFSLSLGTVAPLYLTVTRCRDSGIRYRALNLMSYCQRREGLWDSELAARIAKRTVAIEEIAARIDPGTAYRPGDIRIEARVQSLNVHFDNDRDVKVRYNQDQSDFCRVEDVFSW